MKTSKELKEFRNLTDADLTKKIKESKKELLDLRVKLATGALDKPARINELRKNVARMMTILRERELSKGGEE